MSRENLDVVRAFFDAWTRRDMESLLSLMDAEVVLMEPAGMPDRSRTLHGHPGVMEAIARWPDQWDDFQLELLQVVEAGDDVLVRTHQSGRGKGSGVEVAQDFWYVFRFRHGKIAEWQIFEAERDALEAVGHSE